MSKFIPRVKSHVLNYIFANVNFAITYPMPLYCLFAFVYGRNRLTEFRLMFIIPTICYFFCFNLKNNSLYLELYL